MAKELKPFVFFRLTALFCAAPRIAADAFARRYGVVAAFLIIYFNHHTGSLYNAVRLALYDKPIVIQPFDKESIFKAVCVKLRLGWNNRSP